MFNSHPKCPANGTLNYEVYEIISSGLTNRGGCFTIVDIDTSSSLPTLTYTMFEAGAQVEKGRLTILDTHGGGAGVITHELLQRSGNKTLDYDDCSTNFTGPTYAYPTIGGLE